MRAKRRKKEEKGKEEPFPNMKLKKKLNKKNLQPTKKGGKEGKQEKKKKENDFFPICFVLFFVKSNHSEIS